MKYSNCIHKSVCKHVIVDEVCVGGCNDKYYESTKLLEEAVDILQEIGDNGSDEINDFLWNRLKSFLIRAKERR